MKTFLAPSSAAFRSRARRSPDDENYANEQRGARTKAFLARNFIILFNLNKSKSN